MTKKEKRIEEAKAQVERAFEELAQTLLKSPGLESKARAFAFKRFEAARRLLRARLMDTEETLILEELALVKAQKEAERMGVGFSIVAATLLELSSQAYARGMTEDEFLNPDKSEEDFFMNTIRDALEDAARDNESLDAIHPDPPESLEVAYFKALSHEPESLEAAIEELKEWELWPWDIKQ